MKERGILFSAPMVRALLDGRKTQTRRAVKNPDYYGCLTGDCPHWDKKLCAADLRMQSPYGVPGDRLYVKETFAVADPTTGLCMFRADEESRDYKGRWKPSIFMPRAASRITLELIDVRAEPLHDISEPDAMAEGVDWEASAGLANYTARKLYRELWESINGKGTWAANPWVWALSFKRVPQ